MLTIKQRILIDLERKQKQKYKQKLTPTNTVLSELLVAHHIRPVQISSLLISLSNIQIQMRTFFSDSFMNLSLILAIWFVLCVIHFCYSHGEFTSIVPLCVCLCECTTFHRLKLLSFPLSTNQPNTPRPNDASLFVYFY